MALNGMLRSVNAEGEANAPADPSGGAAELERLRKLRELEALRLQMEAALPASSVGAPGSAPGPVHAPERQPTMRLNPLPGQPAGAAVQEMKLPGLPQESLQPLPAGGAESRVEPGLRGLRGDVDAEALVARGGEPAGKSATLPAPRAAGAMPLPGAEGPGAVQGQRLSEFAPQPAVQTPLPASPQPPAAPGAEVPEAQAMPGGKVAPPAPVASSLTPEPGEARANGKARPVLPDGEGVVAAAPNEKNVKNEQTAEAAGGHVAVPQPQPVPGQGDPMTAEPGAEPDPARVAGLPTVAKPEAGAGGGQGASTQPQAPGSQPLRPPQPMSVLGRQQAEQELAALRGEAMTRLPWRLRQVVEAGEGFFVGDHARQEAALAAARLRELEANPGSATLTDQDLNFLYQVSHSVPLVRRMHGLKQQLLADDGLQKQLAEQRQEETLRQQQPQVWAARQRQRLGGMDAAQLTGYLAGQSRTLAPRIQELNRQAGALQTRDQELLAADKALWADNARLLAADGLPDVTAGPDGQAMPTLHPGLQRRYAEHTHRLKQWQAESAPLRQRLAQEQTELLRERDLSLHARQLLDQHGEQAARQQAAELGAIGQQTMPGARLVMGDMQATQAQFQTRLQELQRQHPQGLPPAVQQAVVADMQASLQAAAQRAEQRMAAAQAAYAGLKAKISESPDLAQALRGNARNNLAQALNLTREQAQALLDDVENMDWEVPLGRQLERPLNLVERLSGEHPKARVLTNGSIIVHPAFHGDEQAYRAAVAAAPEATAEARQRALAAWPQVQRQWAAQIAPGLMEEQDIPGLPSFMKWREEQISQDQATRGQTGFTKLDTEDQVLKYVAEMKNRPGWQKYTDTFVRKLVSSGGSVGASMLGLAAMTQKFNPLNYLLQKATGIDGSQVLAEASAHWTRSNQAISGSLALKGGLDTLGLKATAVLADLVPQFGSMVMGGSVLKGLQLAKGLQTVQLGRWATAGLNGAQSAGQAFASTYTQLRGQGLTHEQAFSRTLPAAVGSGVATAALGLVMDKLGASALKDPARALNTPAVRQGMREVLVQQMRTFTAKAAGGSAALGKEMTEEMADGLVNQVIENVALNSGASLEQVIADTLQQSPDTLMAIAEMGAMGRAGHVRLGGGGGVPRHHPSPGQSLPPRSLPAYAQAAAPGAAAGPQSPPQTMAAPQQATAHSLPPLQPHGTPRSGVQHLPPGMDSPAAATLPVGDSPPGSLPGQPPGTGTGTGTARGYWADSPPQVPAPAEPGATATATSAAGFASASQPLPPAPQTQAQTRPPGQAQAPVPAPVPAVVNGGPARPQGPPPAYTPQPGGVQAPAQAAIPAQAETQTPPQGTAQPAAGRPLPGADATPGTHQPSSTPSPVDSGRVPATAEPGVPPPPLPARVNDPAAAMRAHETFGHGQPPGPPPPPLLRGPADASGRGVEIIARLPDGRFHVRSGGQEMALPPAQAAQAVGLPLADFESRMAQATQAALAAPRPAAGTPGAAPPIWQGRARHGDYAEVLSRNPDGTFQIRVDGKEWTRTERDVAYMTGLTKAPLYAMLAKATEGRVGGSAVGLQSSVDGESVPISAPKKYFHAKMENGASSNGHLTPGLPASQSPKNFAEARAALEPLVRKSDEYAKRWKEVQSRLDIVSKAIQPKPGQPSKFSFLNTPAETAERNRLGAEMRKLMEEERVLRKEQDRLAVEARTILAIPETERGKVRFIGEHLENFTPELAKAWKIAREGALIVEQYVHRDLLPEVGVHVAFHDRSSYTHRNDSGILERTTYLTPEAGVITAAHEITHAIECQEVEVVINRQKVIVQPLYEVARKFLLARAQGVAAQKLQDLAPDGSYKPHEMAFEDDWHNKGGDHYTGRDYSHAMTEIFTMGLERMHNDPVRFFSEDPEHFAIILQLRYPIQP